MLKIVERPVSSNLLFQQTLIAFSNCFIQNNFYEFPDSVSELNHLWRSGGQTLSAGALAQMRQELEEGVNFTMEEMQNAIREKRKRYE